MPEISSENLSILRRAAVLALRSIEDHRDQLEGEWKASGGISVYQESMMRLGMPIWLQKKALEIIDATVVK